MTWVRFLAGSAKCEAALWGDGDSFVVRCTDIVCPERVAGSSWNNENLINTRGDKNRGNI